MRDIVEIDAREELAERPREILGVLGASQGIEGHRARQDLVERKEADVGFARPGVRRTQGGVDLLVRSPAEGRAAAPELHQEDGDLEDVRRRGELLAGHLLGWHVPW